MATGTIAPDTLTADDLAFIDAQAAAAPSLSPAIASRLAVLLGGKP